MLEFGIFDWVEASERSPGAVYEHKLELAAAADRAGFHAYLIAEHQGTPLSIDGSPSVLLSAMIQRTRRLRVGALTFCLPWYNAYRFYNEVCMLDQLSGGRLELGVGRGVSPIESLIFDMKSIEESRERYRETLEVFFEACKGRVLNFQGKYCSYRDVELHNKPVQQPYPPLWFPSSNRESIEFTASRSSSPRATATIRRCLRGPSTASRSSTSTARSGSATGTTRAGTTGTSGHRTSRRPSTSSSPRPRRKPTALGARPMPHGCATSTI